MAGGPEDREPGLAAPGETSGSACPGRKAWPQVTGVSPNPGRIAGASYRPPEDTEAIARCSSSSLMPQPYGIRGGWCATFRGGVLEYAMRAGFTGQGPAPLTEVTADG